MKKNQLSAAQKRAIVDLYAEKKNEIEKARKEEILNSPECQKLFNDFLKMQEKFKKAIKAFEPAYKEYYTAYLNLVGSNYVNHWDAPNLSMNANKDTLSITLNKELTIERLKNIYTPEYAQLPDVSILQRDLELKSIGGEFDVDEFINSYLK